MGEASHYSSDMNNSHATSDDMYYDYLSSSERSGGRRRLTLMRVNQRDPMKYVRKGNPKNMMVKLLTSSLHFFLVVYSGFTPFWKSWAKEAWAAFVA